MHDPEWTGETLTYVSTQDSGDLVVSLDEGSYDKVSKLLEQEPCARFLSALERAQQRFYPGSSATFPWDAHKNALEDAHNSNAISKLVRQRWPVAWYWKALISTLGKWDERCKGDWRVAIRQVRQWVVVTVYEQRDGQVQLLRSPLFGPSERILQTDLYWILLQNQERIAKAWDRAFDSGGEYECLHVIGRHDVVYKIHDVQPVAKSKNSAHGLKVMLEPSLVLHPHRTSEENFPELIKSLVSMPGEKKPILNAIEDPYPLLQVPAFQNVSHNRRHVSLLLSSDRVCEALASLSEIWNDQTTKSVLIHAPPGSGKEILARSIFDLRRNTGKYESFALSPDPALADANQRMLYFRDMRDEEASAEVVAMSRDDFDAASQMANSVSDGLVFKARKGVLFLDEIDKEEEGRTRASLLRLLENDEFAVYGTTLVVKIPRNQIPTYVFAASQGTLDDVLKLKPADFWTRISHVVEMKHPLAGASREDQIQICADYFHMFWNQHVPEFFERAGMLPYPLFEKKTESGDITANAFLHDYMVSLLWVLLDPHVERTIAGMFASVVLQGAEATTISVRNIRSVVQRVVFSFIDLLVYDKDFEKPLATIRKLFVEYSRPGATVEIKAKWGDILRRIITDEQLREDDKELFGEPNPQMDMKAIAELCGKVNIEIARLKPEIKGIIEKAIRTIPSLK